MDDLPPTREGAEQNIRFKVGPVVPLRHRLQTRSHNPNPPVTTVERGPDRPHVATSAGVADSQAQLTYVAEHQPSVLERLVTAQMSQSSK
ncbi:hypothetical protein CRENBAI_014344 [Crenichthys baileyi]|uniref:Uncharacterized protein n=1 Tax=Crenichthys baileyi TaxID=28760 RepID=A0AAV9S527_9TELE